MRELRRRGHSAATFARVAGITAGTLSGVLHHARPVTPRTARRIAEALQIIEPIDGLSDIMAAQIEASVPKERIRRRYLSDPGAQSEVAS
jgi:transcriptional regulator with XRE-family HTH domain